MRGLHKIIWILMLHLLCSGGTYAQEPGPHDTIILGAVKVGDEIFGMAYLDEVEIFGRYTDPKRKAELDRLRYNVFKVYPYAVTAAYLLDKVEKETSVRTNKKDRKKYLKNMEAEMKARFKDELKNLSMNQGQILVKLINRQTGRDCYSVIKEIKGGFNARIYQTTAFFFDNNLKNQYDPFGKDKDIEMIVREIESRNYYQYQQHLRARKLAN
jgi:hypothetical protein